jgi:hypothetical protein
MNEPETTTHRRLRFAELYRLEVHGKVDRSQVWFGAQDTPASPKERFGLSRSEAMDLRAILRDHCPSPNELTVIEARLESGEVVDVGFTRTDAQRALAELETWMEVTR